MPVGRLHPYWKQWTICVCVISKPQMRHYTKGERNVWMFVDLVDASVSIVILPSLSIVVLPSVSIVILPSVSIVVLPSVSIVVLPSVSLVVLPSVSIVVLPSVSIVILPSVSIVVLPSVSIVILPCKYAIENDYTVTKDVICVILYKVANKRLIPTV